MSIYSQRYSIRNFEVAKRLDLNCSHAKREKIIMECDGGVSIEVVVILQYVNVSNQHLIYVNYISIKSNKMYVT